MKYIFVPISIVGCGKSTVFRALKQLYPVLEVVENDVCADKREFYSKVSKALKSSTSPAVLLDRNNHLAMHRKEIVQKYAGADVTLVALLFVPPNLDRRQTFGYIMDRIEKRGDNHPQVKSASDHGKARMIVNAFLKSFTPFGDGDHDDQFAHVLRMEWGPDSSQANVQKIISYFQETAGLSSMTTPSAQALGAAMSSALSYQIE